MCSKIIFLLQIALLCGIVIGNSQNVVEIYGPGLNPQNIVMPARYFFVRALKNTTLTSTLYNDVAVEITGKASNSNQCRVWVNKLDRKDGSLIVRYKIYETCYDDFTIRIFFNSKEVKQSPIVYKGPVYPDQCNCPKQDFNLWLQQFGCLNTDYEQINSDLKSFHKVDMKKVVSNIVQKYHKPESVSFCHYVIKNNEVYRDCYGKHVGFNMFADNILLSLARKVVLPDMELVINLGDWPLIRKNTEHLPMFSWCGSDDTLDIVMPTYDITESTLENMGRVTLDILSVQGSVDHKWPDREAKAFWRGRDSREERLKLIDIARANPDLINASLTNFFFFRDKENQYGPKQPHVSFFKFFDYKYQINVDGTVAAYRFPYLLAGGGMVLKQESPYYEHFYKQIKPWREYIPVKRDLSNLIEQILWAKDNDSEALKIAENGRKFANENLLPQHIICYHAVLFSKWSKLISNNIYLPEDMTHVPQPSFTCSCDSATTKHEEL